MLGVNAHLVIRVVMLGVNAHLVIRVVMPGSFRTPST